MSRANAPARLGKGVGWLYANRSRAGNLLLRASSSAGRRLAVHVLTLVRQLALQMFGIVFLVFAISIGYHSILDWRALRLHGGSNTLPMIESVLTILFAYFGVSSFFRAAQSR